METLVAVAFLACPVGMGLMMWFMSKGMRRADAATRPDSVGDLRTEHARLGREIERLEAGADAGHRRAEVSS